VARRFYEDMMAARYMAIDREVNRGGGADGAMLTHLGPREEESMYSSLLDL
jgi:hypothetical protein